MVARTPNIALAVGLFALALSACSEKTVTPQELRPSFSTSPDDPFNITAVLNANRDSVRVTFEGTLPLYKMVTHCANGTFGGFNGTCDGNGSHSQPQNAAPGTTWLPWGGGMGDWVFCVRQQNDNAPWICVSVEGTKPKQVTAYATNVTGTYNGAAFAGMGSCSDNLTPVLTYQNTTQPVNAGTTTFTVTCGANDIHYIAGSANGTITISPAPVVATGGSGSKVFDGSNGTPADCAVSGAYTGDLSCTNNPATAGPNVGSTAIAPVVAGTGLGNYAITSLNGTYTISAATPTATANDGGGVYNGNSYTGSGTCSDGLEPVIAYQGGSAPVNVGTTTFTVTCGEGNSNFTPDVDEGTITITPAPITASAGSGSKTFDGTAGEPSGCSVSGSYTGGLGCTNNPGSAGPNVGSTTINAVIAGDLSNFSVTYVPGTFTITKAQTETVVTCPASVPFGRDQNGDPQAQEVCTAVVTGPGGLNETLTVSYQDNVHVGTATGSASYPGSDNYEASSDDATFEITRGSNAEKQGTIDFTYPATKTWGDGPFAVTPTSGVPFNLCASTPPTGYSAGFSCTSSDASNQLHWSVTDEAICSVDGDGNVTINAAGNCQVNLIRDGFSVESADDGDTYSFLAAAGSESFEVTVASHTIVINKAPVTATGGSGSHTYNGLTGTPSACGLSGAYLNGLSCTNSPVAVGPGAGTYAVAPVVTSSLNDIGNFDITPVNGSYTINKAGLVVTAANQGPINLGNAVPPCSLSGNFVNGETMAVLSGGSCSVPNPTTAGTFYYVPSGFSSDNYNITYANGSLIVNLPFYGVIGWLEPIAPTMPDRARMKAGSNIPAKFRITGGNGTFYQDPGAKLTVYFCGTTLPTSPADCGTPVPGFVNLPMRYDASAGQHIYNVNTAKDWRGYYRFVGVLSPTFGLPDVTGQSKTTLLGYIEIVK